MIHRRSCGFRFLCSLVLLFPLQTLAQFDHFATRSGDRLLDGDRQLRFISFNTPNLHDLEDYLPLSHRLTPMITAEVRRPKSEVREGATGNSQFLTSDLGPLTSKAGIGIYPQQAQGGQT